MSDTMGTDLEMIEHLIKTVEALTAKLKKSEEELALANKKLSDNNFRMKTLSSKPDVY